MKLVYIDRKATFDGLGTHYIYKLRDRLPLGKGVFTDYEGTPYLKLRKLVEKLGNVPVDGWVK